MASERNIFYDKCWWWNDLGVGTGTGTVADGDADLAVHISEPANLQIPIVCSSVTATYAQNFARIKKLNTKDNEN